MAGRVFIKGLMIELTRPKSVSVSVSVSERKTSSFTDTDTHTHTDTVSGDGDVGINYETFNNSLKPKRESFCSMKIFPNCRRRSAEALEVLYGPPSPAGFWRREFVPPPDNEKGLCLPSLIFFTASLLGKRHGPPFRTFERIT